MAFIVTVFKEDDSTDTALDAFSGEYNEILDSMSDEDYPNDLLDKIDAATNALGAETPGAQKTVWHFPYSIEVRKA